MVSVSVYVLLAIFKSYKKKNKKYKKYKIRKKKSQSYIIERDWNVGLIGDCICEDISSYNIKNYQQQQK